MHHDPLAIKTALNVGKKLLAMIQEKGQAQDSDLFRRILGSSQEILAEAVRHSPPELHAQYPQVAWGEILAMPHYTLTEFVDLDDAVFWSNVGTYMPLLLRAGEAILESHEPKA